MRDIGCDDCVDPEPKAPHCKCGYPDMPGSCPGWRNCPMCDEEEAEVTDE